MATGKKDSWPREITRGNVTVKVYRQKAPRSKTGFEYVLAWRDPAGRQRKPYADMAKALDEASTKAEKLNAGQIAAAGMDGNDRDELVAARQIAGDVPLVAAMEEWARARKLCGGSLIPAAELWAKKDAVTFKRTLASDALEDFIKYKETRGKKGERTYRAKLGPVQRYFPKKSLDEITTLEWSSYLGQWSNGVTQNDHRKRAVEMCKWARDVAGYLPRGVKNAIEYTEPAKEAASGIGILTPDTWEKSLRWILENRPDHLAALTIAGFCGVRSDEIHGKLDDRKKLGAASRRQVWEDFDLTQKHLNVTIAKENTPAWRFVPLCDAALAWLKLCPGERSGPICVPGAMEKLRWLLINMAKIELPENCFRHSYITYEIAVTGNKAQVATWAGNSVKEIDKRYRRPALPATGKAWFAVMP